MKRSEVVIEKKSKKIICIQTPMQYYFTIPKCKKGSIGGYCIVNISNKIPNYKIPRKSCRKIHLTVNDLKKKRKKQR